MANATSLNKRRWHSAPVLLLVLRVLLFELLLSICVGVEAATVTWGHVNKYALRIYEQDVLLGQDHSNATIDISYPAEGEWNVYTITAVHAYDMTSIGPGPGGVDDKASATFDDVGATAELLGGGIGYNFTVVRFHRPNGNMGVSYHGDVHFKLVVYGLDL